VEFSRRHLVFIFSLVAVLMLLLGAFYLGTTLSQPISTPEPDRPGIAQTPRPLTLTILYTGEVYGEVMPCPS
jgi:hypothetical protein